MLQSTGNMTMAQIVNASGKLGPSILLFNLTGMGPSLENFAVAYHFCLAFAAKKLFQHGTRSIDDPFIDFYRARLKGEPQVW